MNLGRLFGLFFVTYCLMLFGYLVVGAVTAYVMIAPERDQLGALGRILLDVGGSTLKDSFIWLGGLEGVYKFIPTSGTIIGTAPLRLTLAHALVQIGIFAFVVNFALSRRFTFGAAMLMPIVVVGLTYSLLEARLTSVGGVDMMKLGVVVAAQYLGLLLGYGTRIFFRGHLD